jgi:hypothetical protein
VRVAVSPNPEPGRCMEATIASFPAEEATCPNKYRVNPAFASLFVVPAHRVLVMHFGVDAPNPMNLAVSDLE